MVDAAVRTQTRRDEEDTKKAWPSTPHGFGVGLSFTEQEIISKHTFTVFFFRNYTA
jgi:hypothetical protein